MIVSIIARFSHTGIQKVSEAIQAVNHNDFELLPPSVQAEAFQKLYIHFVRHQGPAPLIEELRLRAIPGGTKSDAGKTVDFVPRLREGIRQIEESQDLAGQAVDELLNATAAIEPDDRYEERQSLLDLTVAELPSAVLVPRIAPRLWEGLEAPVRIALIGRAMAGTDRLERINRSERDHVEFLIETVSEWGVKVSSKERSSCQALLVALNQDSPEYVIRGLFWREFYRSLPLEETIKSLPPEILFECLKGLLWYLTEPLLRPVAGIPSSRIPRHAAALHPKWRGAFSPNTAEALKALAEKPSSQFKILENSEDHGAFLAEAFLSIARYPLTLDPQRLNTILMEAVADDLPVLKEILLFMTQEAFSSHSDGPLVKAFWFRLNEELRKSQAKESLRALIALILIHERRQTP